MTIPFKEEELEVVGYDTSVRDGNIPLFKYPVTPKEAWLAALRDKKPVWLLCPGTTSQLLPECVPDYKARGFLSDPEDMKNDAIKGGLDMFGVEWVYVPVARGSMEKMGEHKFLDANDWRTGVKFPDLDAMDWEGAAKHTMKFANSDYVFCTPIFSGFTFERLLSFMGFEETSVALIDEDQEEALGELLDALADFACDLIDKMVEYLPMDMIQIHDDWGSQRGPLFSFNVGKEIFVPRMKKITDRIHSHGKIAELHSCGCNQDQIENFLAAGWDYWPPMSAINDTVKLYEEHGDKMVIAVYPHDVPDEFESDEEARACARRIVDELCTKPGYVCVLARDFAPKLKGVFAEELYRASRKAYAQW